MTDFEIVLIVGAVMYFIGFGIWCVAYLLIHDRSENQLSLETFEIIGIWRRCFMHVGIFLMFIGFFNV